MPATSYLPLVVATIPNSALPTLSREDRHRLTRFFALNEDLAALAADLISADSGLRTGRHRRVHPPDLGHLL